MAGSPVDRNYLIAFGMRLEKLLTLLGWTAADLADHLGYSTPDQVFRCIRGKNAIRIDKLPFLVTIPTTSGEKRCNLHWLLTGEGLPFLDQAAPTEPSKEQQQLREVAEYLAVKLGSREALRIAKAIRR